MCTTADISSNSQHMRGQEGWDIAVPTSPEPYVSHRTAAPPTEPLLPIAQPEHVPGAAFCKAVISAAPSGPPGPSKWHWSPAQDTAYYAAIGGVGEEQGWYAVPREYTPPNYNEFSYLLVYFYR